MLYEVDGQRDEWPALSQAVGGQCQQRGAGGGGRVGARGRRGGLLHAARRRQGLRDGRLRGASLAQRC